MGMLAGYVYFVFRPNSRLLTRLSQVEAHVADALGEAVVMPVQLAEESLGEEVLVAMKALFVARVGCLTVSAEDASLVFGEHFPAGADFEEWWTLEVIVHDVYLSDTVAALREAGMLDALGEGVRQLVQRLTR